MPVAPLQQSKLDGGCVWLLGRREGGLQSARSRFRSCFENATRPHIKNATADCNHVFIRGHTPLMKVGSETDDAWPPGSNYYITNQRDLDPQERDLIGSFTAEFL